MTNNLDPNPLEPQMPAGPADLIDPSGALRATNNPATLKEKHSPSFAPKGIYTASPMTRFPKGHKSLTDLVQAARETYREVEEDFHTGMKQSDAIQKGTTLDDFRRMDGDDGIEFAAGLVI